MHQTDPLTQAQLNYVFTQLGYRLTEVENGPCVWQNPEYDAVMLLPAIAPEQPARQYHVTTLRRIAIEKGIIEPEAFDALLENARKQPLKPSVKQDAA